MREEVVREHGCFDLGEAAERARGEQERTRERERGGGSQKKTEQQRPLCALQSFQSHLCNRRRQGRLAVVDVADRADVQVRLAPGVDVIGRVGGEAPPGALLEEREQRAAAERGLSASGRGSSRRRHHRRRCHRRGQALQRRVDGPGRRAAGRGQEVGAHRKRKERGSRMGGGKREDEFPFFEEENEKKKRSAGKERKGSKDERERARRGVFFFSPAAVWETKQAFRPLPPSSESPDSPSDGDWGK